MARAVVIGAAPSGRYFVSVSYGPALHAKMGAYPSEYSAEELPAALQRLGVDAKRAQGVAREVDKNRPAVIPVV